jgi:hypothetical protein
MVAKGNYLGPRATFYLGSRALFYVGSMALFGGTTA